MSGFDLLYSNMHRDISKTNKSNENTLKENKVTIEDQESKKSESTKNPFVKLFSKIL